MKTELNISTKQFVTMTLLLVVVGCLLALSIFSTIDNTENKKEYVIEIVGADIAGQIKLNPNTQELMLTTHNLQGERQKLVLKNLTIHDIASIKQNEKLILVFKGKELVSWRIFKIK